MDQKFFLYIIFVFLFVNLIYAIYYIRKNKFGLLCKAIPIFQLILSLVFLFIVGINLLPTNAVNDLGLSGILI